MDRTPHQTNSSSLDGSKRTPPPNTPGWFGGLFAWSTSKKKRAIIDEGASASRMTHSPAREMPLPFVSRLEMGSQASLVDSQVDGCPKGKVKAAPSLQQAVPTKRPESTGVVTFAPSVPHHSPWRPPSTSRFSEQIGSQSSLVDSQVDGFSKGEVKAAPSLQQAVPTKRPESTGVVTFAPSVPHHSPWRPPSTSRLSEQMASPGRMLLPANANAPRQTKQIAKRRMRAKYRPSSDTLNKHILSKRSSNEIRRGLIQPHQLLPQQPKQSPSSLAKSVVLFRKGRTLNQSHSRLLADAYERKRTLESETETTSIMGSGSSEQGHQPKKRRVKFQQEQDRRSPQSTGSSHGSSTNSFPAEPPSLRPTSLDEPYQCILETGDDDDHIDFLTFDTHAPSLVAPLMVLKPKHREYLGDEIARISELVRKEEESGQHVELQEHAKPKIARQNSNDDAKWECSNCGHKNPNDESACEKCGHRRSARPTSSTWDAAFLQESQKGWKCDVCYARNPDTVDVCGSCNAPRPSNEATEDETREKESADGSTAESKPSSGSMIGSNGFVFSPGRLASGSNKNNKKMSDPVHSTGFQFSGAFGKVSGASSSPITNGPAQGGFIFTGSSTPSKSSSAAETKARGKTIEPGPTSGPSEPKHAPSFGIVWSESQITRPTPAALPLPFGAETSKPPVDTPKSEELSSSFPIGSAAPLESENKEVKVEASDPSSVSSGAPAARTQQQTTGPATSSRTGTAPPGPSSGFAWPTAQADKKQSSLSVESGLSTQDNGARPVVTDPAAAPLAPPFGGGSEADLGKQKCGPGTDAAAVPTSSGSSAPLLGAPSTSGTTAASHVVASEGDRGPAKKRRSRDNAAPTNGESASSSMATKSLFQFGASSSVDASNNASTVPPGNSAGFSFGNVSDQATTNAGVGSTTTPAPVAPFGATTFGAPIAQNPAHGPSFTSQTPNSLFKFGSNSTGGTDESAKATAGPTFGQPGFGGTPAAAPQQASGPAFGAGPSQTFGGSSTTTAGPFSGKSTAPGFGGTAPSTTFGSGSAPAPAFGAPSAAPAPGFQANFAFGSSGATNTTSVRTTTSGFGTGQTSTPGTGGWAPFPSAGNPPIAPTFGPTTPGPSFGAATGASTQFGTGAPTQFGSATSASGGMQTSTTPGVFGNATPNAPGGLGQPATQGFGSATPSALGFGTGSGASSGFSMGTGGSVARRRKILKARRPNANK